LVVQTYRTWKIVEKTEDVVMHLRGTRCDRPRGLNARISIKWRAVAHGKWPRIARAFADEQYEGTVFVFAPLKGKQDGIGIYVPPLFAYDYAEMTANMAGLRRELLSVVMHPRNVGKLQGLQLV
jgi:hypothetical protein